MCKRIAVVLLLGVLLLGSTGQAQNFTCSVQNQTSTGGVYTFDVYMLRTTPATKLLLGDADLAFTFNNANFTSPTISWITGVDPAGRIESFYGVSPAFVPGFPNRIVISLSKPTFSTQGQFDSRVDTISTIGNGTLIGRFTITGISNPAGTAGLAWRSTAPNQTVVFTMAATTPWASTDITTPNGTYTPPVGTPLPIQLANFTAATVSKSAVKLSWETLSEINNYGFEVQKSADKSAAFQSITGAFIAGNGTTAAKHDYSYVDNSYVTGNLYRLKQIDLTGTSHFTDAVDPLAVTSIAPKALPTVYSLSQNYPNPFNPSTVIEFALPKDAHVTLEVYNIIGQKVMTLVDEVTPAGYHSVKMDGTSLSSGMYLYRLTTGQQTFTKKLLLMK